MQSRISVIEPAMRQPAGPGARRTALLLSSISLFAIFLLPLRVESWLDGVPWTNTFEIVLLAVVVPLLFLLARGFLTLPVTATALVIVLIGNVIVFFAAPASGWLVRVYQSQSQAENGNLIETYASLWHPGVSGVLDRPWLDKRMFPIESIVELDPDFLAAGGGYQTGGEVDALSLSLWVDINGVVHLPANARLAIVAAGATSASLKGVDHSGNTLAIPVVADSSEIEFSRSASSLRVVISGRIAYAGTDWSLIPILVFEDGRTEFAFDQGVLWQHPAALERSNSALRLLTGLGRLIDSAVALLLFVWFVWALWKLVYLNVLSRQVAIVSAGSCVLPWLIKPIVENVVLPILFALEGWLGPYPNDLDILIGVVQLGGALIIACGSLIGLALRYPQAWAVSPGTLASRVFAVFAPVLLSFFLVQWWSDIGRMAEEVNTSDDWHSYRVFARIIAVEGRVLFAGESVFDYQPFYRYIVALLHIFFGQSTLPHRLLDVWCLLGAAVLLSLCAARYSPLAGLMSTALYLVSTTTGVLFWHIGRGLTEYTAMALMLLAIWVLGRESRGWRLRVVVSAGLSVLAFWTRNDHLFVLAALAVVALGPISGTVREVWGALARRVRTQFAQLSTYTAILIAGVALLVLRNWLVGGGTISPYHLERSFSFDWFAVTRNLYVLLTASKINYPPQPIVFVLLPGVILGLLAMVWRPPLLQILPLWMSFAIAGTLAPYFVVNIYLGYPGRFSIHLLPFCALILGIILSRAFWPGSNARKPAAI